MTPQSNPVAGFDPIDNLRIMPENSICSSLVGDEARGRPTVPVTVENVGQIALSTDNAGFRIRAGRGTKRLRIETLFSDLRLAN
jgi:hypothetical protein